MKELTLTKIASLDLPPGRRRSEIGGHDYPRQLTQQRNERWRATGHELSVQDSRYGGNRGPSRHRRGLSIRTHRVATTIDQRAKRLEQACAQLQRRGRPGEGLHQAYPCGCGLSVKEHEQSLQRRQDTVPPNWLALAGFEHQSAGARHDLLQHGQETVVQACEHRSKRGRRDAGAPSHELHARATQSPLRRHLGHRVDRRARCNARTRSCVPARPSDAAATSSIGKAQSPQTTVEETAWLGPADTGPAIRNMLTNRHRATVNSTRGHTSSPLVGKQGRPWRRRAKVRGYSNYPASPR